MKVFEANTLLAAAKQRASEYTELRGQMAKYFNKILPWENEEIEGEVILKCEMINSICAIFPFYNSCLKTVSAYEWTKS